MKDIPTIASETGVHTALVAALSQAGLVEVHKQTVLSPYSPQQTKFSPMQEST